MRRAGLGGPPGDVEQGCDVQVGKELALGCVIGTSKVKERKDFNWAALEAGAKDNQETLISLLFGEKKENNPDLYVFNSEVPSLVPR